jgi:hypothetical protein
LELLVIAFKSEPTVDAPLRQLVTSLVSYTYISALLLLISSHLDINQLVGNKLPVQIPAVLVKWVTYPLVLHIIALGLAGISALFGLLAHVREMSMTCFSSCISGFAAGVALLAFIFDISLFFIAKSRLDKVQGGSAAMGNAIWFTLAAWVLLFFSGCFYTFGRCCIKNRSGGRDQWDNKDSTGPPFGGNTGYAEQMRLDAVKAEADRKARQRQGEGGLPAFQEYEPLQAKVTDEGVYLDEEAHAMPYSDQHNARAAAAGSYAHPSSPGGYSGGGYVQAPTGTPVNTQYLSTNPQDPYGHTQGGTSCMLPTFA